MDIYEYFTKEKEKLEEKINNAKEYIGEGEEYVTFHVKENNTYLYLTNRGQKRRYLKKEEYKKYLSEIKRAYYIKQLKYDEMYLIAINAFIKKFNPKVQKAEIVFQNNEELAKLLFPEINIVSKKLLAWFEAGYSSDPPFPEKRTIKTVHGEKVRSKSERDIADSLLTCGVPYRYEWKIDINGITMHPDFVIRHPKTGKFFIWEHLGRADDDQYLLDSFRKLEIYAKAGYIVGKNLIITTETVERTLEMETINEVIKRNFLS